MFFLHSSLFRFGLSFYYCTLPSLEDIIWYIVNHSWFVHHLCCLRGSCVVLRVSSNRFLFHRYSVNRNTGWMQKYVKYSKYDQSSCRIYFKPRWWVWTFLLVWVGEAGEQITVMRLKLTVPSLLESNPTDKKRRLSRVLRNVVSGARKCFSIKLSECRELLWIGTATTKPERVIIFSNLISYLPDVNAGDIPKRF